MKRIQAAKLIILVLGLLLLCLSLRCENLTERRARQRAQEFDAADFARDFWDHRLPQVFDRAKEARTLLHLFNTDMPAAIRQGRTLGESRVHAYLLQGDATVIARTKRGLTVSVTEPASNPEILFTLGAFVSGNAVRDASGLVDVSSFTDTMKFNQVSFEINKILVQEVIQPFIEAQPKVGQSIRFIGAAEVAEDATEKHAFGKPLDDSAGDKGYHLLKLIPIRLTLE